jgi:hypothetical protein
MLEFAKFELQRIMCDAVSIFPMSSGADGFGITGFSVPKVGPRSSAKTRSGLHVFNATSGVPPGWFDEAEITATAQTFLDPDGVAITLNVYPSRWMPVETAILAREPRR